MNVQLLSLRNRFKIVGKILPIQIEGFSRLSQVATCF